MCSETVPKDFVKTTEMLPLATYGLTTIEEHHKAEDLQHHREWLMKAGLNEEEITLYNDNQSGLLKRHCKIESSVLRSKLDSINSKIKQYQQNDFCTQHNEKKTQRDLYNFSGNLQNKFIKFYPEGHPMHKLKKLENNLFGHLSHDTTSPLPVTKRRKIFRRLERKKERIISQHVQPPINNHIVHTKNKPGSLWDVKDMSPKTIDITSFHYTNSKEEHSSSRIIGPKKPTMYTIKDNKIVRLEPSNSQDEYKAVDIVTPVNPAEAQLLEGTKMTLDDIKKIDRFKDYDPGKPSKVLYLKNIAPSLTPDKLSSLFNQFIVENGGPIDVRLMSGRMRGQAFVAFQNDTVAKRALNEVNGTILSGRPIIVQFGKNSNRIQSDENTN